MICFPFTLMLLGIMLNQGLPPKLIYNTVCHPLYSRYVLYYMLLKQHSYIGCEFFSTNFQTTAYKICARYVQINCNDVNEKWHQIPYITLKHFGAARYELHVTKVFSMHIAVSTYFLGSEYMLYLQLYIQYLQIMSWCNHSNFLFDFALSYWYLVWSNKIYL